MAYVKFKVSDCNSPMTIDLDTGYMIDQKGVMWYIGKDFVMCEEPPEERPEVQQPFDSDTVLKLAAILSDTQNGKAYLEGDK